MGLIAVAPAIVISEGVVERRGEVNCVVFGVASSTILLRFGKLREWMV
jgi:hypothetical protein